jgi:dihydroorotate dehydrogenase electron transfer subunit
LHINIDHIRIVNIDNIIQETPSIRTLIFRDKLSSNAHPGQFLMVWIPRVEELPLSVMISDKKMHAAITIRKGGFGSTALFNKKVGEIIGIRGPYGNHFTITKNMKKALLIGGGTGLVPLMRLATKMNEFGINSTFVMGARSKTEVFFEKQANCFLKNTKHKVIVTTDDGSYGFKGSATDTLATIIKEEKFDRVYTCGPELMMKKVFALASEYSVSVEASLERYMKCGIGICGSCCVGEQLVCKEGTVFNEKDLRLMTEFGRIYRDKTGRKSHIVDYN